MIIDFHTHVFPEKIAQRTIEKLATVANIKAYTDGTLNSLKESMKEAGIDYSVILPVVTKPEQFQTVNDYAAQISETSNDGIISFGGIHPQSKDYKNELNYIKSLGLKGIKLHPDYQNTFVDDENMIKIMDYAANLDLMITLHAGIDVGLPAPVHCPTDKALKVINIIDYDKIILAHTGGFGLWDDVEKYLVNKKVFLDISYSLGQIPDEQLIRIINHHGADRVLFATDSPWDGQKEDVLYFKSLDITDEKKELIFSQNARKLLNI